MIYNINSNVPGSPAVTLSLNITVASHYALRNTSYEKYFFNNVVTLYGYKVINNPAVVSHLGNAFGFILQAVPVI